MREPEPALALEPPSAHADGAAAEAPMLELEELGPASEYDDEPVVEATLAAEPHAELEILGEHELDDDDHAAPPESGRELVTSPRESQRVTVAAPALPDDAALELLELSEESEPEPPSLLRAAVVRPRPPTEARLLEAPPVEARPSEAPASAALAPEVPAFELQAPEVVRARIPAAHAAAYLTAARAPRPETFGALLDAALEL
jgi:hypothetical protein